MSLPLDNCPHRRYNPLKDEWVLVSPHRNKRPWQGKSESAPVVNKPAHDPACYLCPGNMRVNGVENPAYTGPYVFTNDFPALLEQQGTGGDLSADLPSASLLRAEPVSGTARVICFSEQHNLTLAELPVADTARVVDLWISQTQELGQRYPWVAIFENKGEIMGCSNPHPHGQVWASNFIPNEIVCEDAALAQYLASTETNLLVEYAALEAKDGARTIVENDDWIAVVPYWATWPFEALLLPKRHVLQLPELSATERASLAEILKSLCTRYDNLFETEFPYSMGWHGAPFTNADNRHWQLHAHFYPPLLRSATVRKFMVGYEMLAEAQRDITAETAAAQLRSMSEIHHKTKSRSS